MGRQCGEESEFTLEITGVYTCSAKMMPVDAERGEFTGQDIMGDMDGTYWR